MPALAESGEGAGEVLTVGVPTDRCPVFYQDAESGKIMGIGADLMRTAAESAGYTVSFERIGEQTLKEALDNPKYDLVMPFGSAIESAAGQSTVVSENLFQTPFTIVTEPDREVPPLNELHVGMLRSQGGVVDTVHQLYPDIEVSLYDNMAECVRALRSRKVDALLHNSYVWNYILQKPSYSDLAVQPQAMFAMDFRAGALDTPDGQAMIKLLNRGIAELTDTQRQAIILDYTSRRLYRYDLTDYLDLYGVVLLLSFLLMVSLTVSCVLYVRALRLKQEEKIRQMVDYDALTGVLTLAGFRKRVQELLRAHPDTPYMLTFSNIRGFKYLNSSLGKDACDELLRFWARRCQESQSEAEVFGRVGADCFAALICIPDEEKIRRDERDVLNPVRNYFVDRGKENQVQIASGVYILTQEDYQSADVDRMLDYARIAEKRDQSGLISDYNVYNPALWEKGKRGADIVGHLPLALRSGEIQVWYQPQVDAETRCITGLEALCRWNHATLGWISPAEFIPVLEEAGLIYEIDSYVWERVCQDLQRWDRQGAHRSVSVNLSRNDIQENRDIPGHFLHLLRTYGLSAGQLRIEITESAYMEEPVLLIQTTEKLREYGFQVEMDDFGSGYSSLNMLKEVPVDRIKLDLHFLTTEGDLEKAREIVIHIIRLIHSIGLNLIAEGVETAEQRQFLQSHGCREMQGYYFYKPMPAEEIDQISMVNEEQ